MNVNRVAIILYPLPMGYPKKQNVKEPDDRQCTDATDKQQADSPYRKKRHCRQTCQTQHFMPADIASQKRKPSQKQQPNPDRPD